MLEISTVMTYCGETKGQDSDIDALFEVYLKAAVNMVESWTGYTPEEIQGEDDMLLLLMILCNEMHNNRTMTVDRNNLNPTAEYILRLHDKNLL